MAGSGYETAAAALGPAMRALSNSTGIGSAHFGALAGVGKGQRVSTACKCFTKFRLWLMNTARKFGPYPRTNRGTPGVGL